MNVVTVSVTGVSGSEKQKGSVGVGKSLLCNRFVRGDYDDFYLGHSSTLSQTDFCGSPVINSNHWLYWGERVLEVDRGQTAQIRVVEQTEFLDDETFEPLVGQTMESYGKRAAITRLESRDKLMYIRQEQLGMEADYPQKILPEGKTNVDAFLFLFDVSSVPKRSFDRQAHAASDILSNLLKTKKPIVVVASKSDCAEETGKRVLHKLLSKRELSKLCVVEVSSIRHVNIDEAFLIAVNLSMRGRTRFKALPYEDAVKLTEEVQKEIRVSFINLLNALISPEHFPWRLSWARLLSEMGLSRNSSFVHFVRVFGVDAAKSLYNEHMNDVKETCMRKRLRALLPYLSNVFYSLLGESSVAGMTWDEALHRIHSHALFDTFFLPLGKFGRLLDPLLPDESQITPKDTRIPAEILLRAEAKVAFEKWIEEVEGDSRRRKLEEDLERLLASSPQAIPGRSFEDMRVFLAGHPVLDSLSTNYAVAVYDRFQKDLIKRSQADLVECLTENVELFLTIIRNRNQRCSVPFVLSDQELHYINSSLQEDERFRHLSVAIALRDSVIKEFASFLAHPLSSKCSWKRKCVDYLGGEAVRLLLAKWKHERLSSRRVELCVYGDDVVVNRFMEDIENMTMDEGFVHCVNGNNMENDGVPRSQLFLLDSISSVKLAQKVVAEKSGKDGLPSIFLLVCDEANYDLIPMLQEQGSLLVQSCGGILLDPRFCSQGAFTHSQLLSVWECARASQLDDRLEMRIQCSFCCGDGFSLEWFLSTFLSAPQIGVTSNAYTCDAGMLALLVESSHQMGVLLRLTSFHSWLVNMPCSPVHGHVLVYSTKRESSWALLRAGVCRILEDGAVSVTGRAIFIVAVTDYSNSQETNVLLTEGIELASSIGAMFLCISSSETDSISQHFLSFIARVRSVIPACFSDGARKVDDSFSKSITSGKCSIFRNVAAATARCSLASPETVNICTEYSTALDASDGSLSTSRVYTPSDSSREFAPTTSSSKDLHESVSAASPAMSVSSVMCSSSQSARNPFPPRRSLPTSHFLNTRSATLEVINAASVMKARKMVGMVGEGGLRQSLSTESLGKKTKKRMTFVRKVKSSLRRKTREVVEHTDDASDKSPFFWLPSRSPKRNRKEEAAPVRVLAALPLVGQVPLFVVDAVEYMEREHCMNCEGIYRLSGVKTHLATMDACMYTEQRMDWTGVDVFSASVGVKNFFANLSEPIIPRSIQKEMVASIMPTVLSLRSAFHSVPRLNRTTLMYLFAHLEKVANSEETAMDCNNLSIVWLPSLLHPDFKDMGSLTTGIEEYKVAIALLIKEWRSVFSL